MKTDIEIKPDCERIIYRRKKKQEYNRCVKEFLGEQLWKK